MSEHSLPQSVPQYLAAADREFWTPRPADFDWRGLDPGAAYAVSGSAFIDLQNPLGPMGNPFAVVVGEGVADFDAERMRAIAQQTRTPETVFIRSCRAVGDKKYEVLVTVLTPTGKELGACAHGFTGAVQTLLECGQLPRGCEITLKTTLDTVAETAVSPAGVISLAFVPQPPRLLTVSPHAINQIFQTEVLARTTELPVLSVGSPKVIIEVISALFANIQAKLNQLDYDKLLAFEDKEQVNGIHVFCRNPQTQLPEKAMQVNAYLGRDNAVDPATGVSAAAQLSADNHVREGAEITLTQYTAKGPSATLQLTKGARTMLVGGTAVLFNFRKL